MGDQKGTGKHPHKSTEEPFPHHGKSSGSEHKSESSSQKGEKVRTAGAGSSSEDLKEREYRDEQGNIHHHTRTKGKKE